MEVVDADGDPVRNRLINFRVTAGRGDVFAGSPVTNASDIAQERWTPGSVAGAAQTVEARVVDSNTGDPIVHATVGATATAGLADSMWVVARRAIGPAELWSPFHRP